MYFHIQLFSNNIYCMFFSLKKAGIPYNLIRQNKPKGIPMKQYNSNQKKKIVLIINKVKNKKA